MKNGSYSTVGGQGGNFFFFTPSESNLKQTNATIAIRANKLIRL